MQKRRKKKKQSRDGIINQADLFSKYWHQHPATETLYQPTGRFEMFYSFSPHCVAKNAKLADRSQENILYSVHQIRIFRQNHSALIN